VSNASASSFFVVIAGARALLLASRHFLWLISCLISFNYSLTTTSHSRIKFLMQILTRSISAVLRYTRSHWWAIRRMSESSSPSVVQAHQCVQVGKNVVCSSHLPEGGGGRRQNQSRNQIYDESHPKKECPCQDHRFRITHYRANIEMTMLDEINIFFLLSAKKDAKRTFARGHPLIRAITNDRALFVNQRERSSLTFHS
jgi:hypothetical protein